MKRPLVGVFLADFVFMCKVYKPCPKDAVCQISECLDCQFMWRYFIIHQKFTPFCPLWGPKRCQPLEFCKLESPFPKDASYQIWLKSVQWFWRRSHFLKMSILDVFPYISLCKMKHPLVGPFLGGFYFYVQTLQTMPQGCCMSNIRVFGLPVHEKKIFKIQFYFLHLFAPYGPNRCQPLDFCKLESTFPKDASYQIWLKSVQWFWRRSHLNEKFTPDATIVHLSLRLMWAKKKEKFTCTICHVYCWSLICL